MIHLITMRVIYIVVRAAQIAPLLNTSVNMQLCYTLLRDCRSNHSVDV